MSSGNKVSLCSILSNSCFDYYKYSGVKKQIFFSVGEYHVWPRKHSGTEHAGFLAPTKKNNKGPPPQMLSDVFSHRSEK